MSLSVKCLKISDKTNRPENSIITQMHSLENVVTFIILCTPFKKLFTTITEGN